MISPVRAVSATTIAGVLTALLMSTPGCRQPDDTDTVLPYIRISFPQAGVSVLDDIATIRAEARDNVGVKQVIFMAEGDTLARLAAEPYVLYWNTTAYPDCTDADSYTLLTALAEDFAGNRRSTQRKFYLDNADLPPLPIELYAPTEVTKHSITLSWEPSVDYYFSHYLLRRDITSDVTADSDSLIGIHGPDTTSFTDQGKGVSPFGLLENTDYYYRIWVYDEYDSSTVSDSIVTARTLLPQPVILSATSTVTKYTAGLEWEASSEDVAYYRLHRGASSQMAALDSIAGFPEGTHSYLDTGLTANTTYYYYLDLIDDAGYTHAFHSDYVVEVQTQAIPTPVLDDPPLAVTKYTATIAWKTIAEQEDSSWVALYRDTGVVVDSTDILLYSAPRNAALTFTDSPLKQGQSYSYRMHHRDSRNNTAWSNTLTLTARTLADVWSGGLGYTQGKYQLELSWDRYNYNPPDFDGYTLSRDGQVIFTSTTAADNQYTDTGLSKNTPYSYRLVVTDTSGASIATTLDASTRDIFPAEIVSIEATDDWSYNLAWLPSREPDSEFHHYELLRSSDTEEIFEDDDGDNTADCLSGSCVQVNDFTQSTDTITYRDNDATLVATSLRDTTLMLPRPVDTTLILPTPVDTTLILPRPVDTTLIVPTAVDTTLLIDETLVDTTLILPRPVDTTLTLPRPVDTTLTLPRPVDTTLTLLLPVDTTVVDTTLPVFNYVVLTYDVAGEYVRSNIVGDTLKPPPTAVTLTIPSPGSSETTIGLEWTRASWPGVLETVFFSRYEVWRNSVPDQEPGAEGSSYELIAPFADIDVTSFSDSQDLGRGKEWFYVVVVRDIFGKGAVSNEVIGWTKP
ncbi:MAG: hypothetical protein JSU77_01135 [Fidelibacterota bacterium]|nr:MAG: hypothetical protein JSU77_01135 [Candidatus Neomarinimicrobiota bacterium]